MSSDFSAEDKLKAVRRELAHRRSLYPRWIAEGRMPQTLADQHPEPAHADEPYRQALHVIRGRLTATATEILDRRSKAPALAGVLSATRRFPQSHLEAERRHGDKDPHFFRRPDVDRVLHGAIDTAVAVAVGVSGELQLSFILIYMRNTLSSFSFT